MPDWRRKHSFKLDKTGENSVISKSDQDSRESTLVLIRECERTKVIIFKIIKNFFWRTTSSASIKETR